MNSFRDEKNIAVQGTCLRFGIKALVFILFKKTRIFLTFTSKCYRQNLVHVVEI